MPCASRSAWKAASVFPSDERHAAWRFTWLSWKSHPSSKLRHATRTPRLERISHASVDMRSSNPVVP
jgi:hypothetical protein